MTRREKKSNLAPLLDGNRKYVLKHFSLWKSTPFKKKKKKTLKKIGTKNSTKKNSTLDKIKYFQTSKATWYPKI